MVSGSRIRLCIPKVGSPPAVSTSAPVPATAFLTQSAWAISFKSLTSMATYASTPMELQYAAKSIPSFPFCRITVVLW